MFNVENTFQNHLSLIGDGGSTREDASEIRSVRKNRSNCVRGKSRRWPPKRDLTLGDQNDLYANR